MILFEIKKEGGVPIEHKVIRRSLKNLGLVKYYGCVNDIVIKLNGINKPKISYDVYNELCEIFIKIEEVYEVCKPKNRKSFISYPYIFYKCVEIIGHNELKVLVRLHKDTLSKLDIIWKKIMEELDYKMI